MIKFNIVNTSKGHECTRRKKQNKTHSPAKKGNKKEKHQCKTVHIVKQKDIIFMLSLNATTKILGCKNISVTENSWQNFFND